MTNMKAPDNPVDELIRLASLRALKLLDTSPEERFDRLTRLAKSLFDVPIALISLVDSDRQWFKSRQGIQAEETPREISFCGHAILQNQLLLVPDATLDTRFADKPLVTKEPFVRFYAGCPLVLPNGSAAGTLCIIDHKPREFSAKKLTLLDDLARVVEGELIAAEIATIDELTMLHNRRGFLISSKHMLGQLRRAKKFASLLFFDLDGFKSINDTYGHLEGDRALAIFALLLKQTFRESDVVCRLGGDEFVVLVDLSANNATMMLDRLREAVDTHNSSLGRHYELKYSVGMSEFDPTNHDNLEKLLALADLQMLQKKRQNRASVPDSDNLERRQ